MRKLLVGGFFIFSFCYLAGSTALYAVQRATASALKKVSSHSMKSSMSQVRPLKMTLVGIRYEVQEGDTLTKIAREHDTMVGTLMRLNQLASTRLRVGQSLLVPKPYAINPQTPALQGRASAESRQTSIEEESSTVSEEANVAPSVSNPNADPASSTSGITLLAHKVADFAQQFLGVRYRRSGTSESRGFDCSGFVQKVLSYFDVSIPRTSREQFQVGQPVDRDALQAGDLVFFRTRGRFISHVGLYLGDNLFIHAARSAKQVVVSNLTQSYYRRHFAGAKRLEALQQAAEFLIPKGN